MDKNELQEETKKADIWEETVGEIWAKGDDSKNPRTTWHDGAWCRRKECKSKLQAGGHIGRHVPEEST